jgi:mono/diheme cytochrome c family protein
MRENDLISPGFRKPQAICAYFRWRVVVLIGLGAIFMAACERGAIKAKPAPPPELSWTHFEVPERPPLTPALLAEGKQVYQTDCAACHGPTGHGDGFCAAFLNPHPRNFAAGIFRFKTTAGSDLPTDKDLFRTVSLGLHNTPMPPWSFLLSTQERWAVVEYVKTLSPAFSQHKPGAPVDLGKEPTDVGADRIARGKQLYADAGCDKCHGEEGYGDGPSADTLKDAAGLPIRPRNFHKAFEFKRGHTIRDVALTITTGNNGTPMPSFRESLEPGQVWDLAAYVMGLADKRLEPGFGSKSAEKTGEHLGRPDVVIKLVERAWKYTPSTIRVRQGEIVRIDFQPSDNGLGAGHGFAIDGYDKDVFINGALVQRPKSVTFVANKAGTFTFYCATQCSTGSLHPNMKGTLVVETKDGSR